MRNNQYQNINLPNVAVAQATADEALTIANVAQGSVVALSQSVSNINNTLAQWSQTRIQRTISPVITEGNFPMVVIDGEVQQLPFEYVPISMYFILGEGLTAVPPTTQLLASIGLDQSNILMTEIDLLTVTDKGGGPFTGRLIRNAPIYLYFATNVAGSLDDISGLMLRVVIDYIEIPFE
jgi:hypothetical protein